MRRCAGLVALSLMAAPAGKFIQFTDHAKEAGIRFVHFKGSRGPSTILEETGPGVCVADFDGDGFQDIYFVSGRDLYQRGISVRNALYRNNGDGTFTDVTDRAAVPGTGYGVGCVWGDYNNDGHPDLYVTQYGKNVLYRNNGDGTFTDVTARAHVDGTDFGTQFHAAATFFDYDRDGRLDLYVGGYVEFGPASKQTCMIGPVRASCPPAEYTGSPNVLYHNNGDGTFTNVTKASGIYRPKGKNLAVGAFDYDNDGWPDLFIANDGMEAYLFRNEHDGTFKEVALTSGMAYTAEGLTMGAMCISAGDYDNDGLLDLYISDFQYVPDHIWHNDGKGYFDEVSDKAGIAAITKNVLSFGGGFFDYDNDGWLDLFIANGHVYEGVEKSDPAVHYKQLNSLFHNNHAGHFDDVASQSGAPFSIPAVGRGVAFADFDNDGNLDLVVANNGGAPWLLHNSGGSGNHFLSLKLAGKRSNRDGLGARVLVRSGGVSQIREISAGGSFSSHSDLRAHFGLGSAARAETIEITWPSGLHQTFHDVPGDRFYLLQEDAQALELEHRK